MTKLLPATNPVCDNMPLTPALRHGEELEEGQPISCLPSQNNSVDTVSCDNGVESGSDSDGTYEEPLGYQDFLCDVNIEYSPGGTRSSSLGHKYCFKMKCLPYMLTHNNNGLSQECSINGSSSDITDCDREESTGRNILNDQTIDLTSISKMLQIDVTKETCAFLGNSDFVPSPRKRANKVAIELVSAKLSQSSGYHIPPNSSLTNLTVLAENQPTLHNSSDTSSLSSYNSHSSNNAINHDSKGQMNSITRLKITPPPPPSSPSSSKKFVNYTILIRTIPGLDRNPAVIERRFSDFLNLYQGLKNEKAYSDIIENYVIFPKKVYMGNFSLEKIAERSIEFSRLLNVCIINSSLTWSVPFISFLIDKELKEAHRLSLFGDPDDVQSLIENAYYIEQKLYLKLDYLSRSTSSSSSLNSAHQNSPLLPTRSSDASDDQWRNESTISAVNDESTSLRPNNQIREPKSNESSPRSSSSRHDSNYLSRQEAVTKSNQTPINQRILVTFCMLFVTYCRSQNHQGLKQAADEFSQLISSQEYVDSLVNTRHYDSLRACLLFLMNLSHKNVVDENLRLLLKRRLEDIDGLHAELGHDFDRSSLRSSNSARRYSLRSDNTNSVSPFGRASRITKKDLTSLLRDRNFCTFQDGKFSR